MVFKCSFDASKSISSGCFFMQRTRTVPPITRTPHMHVIQTINGEGGCPAGVGLGDDGGNVGSDDSSAILFSVDFIDVKNRKARIIIKNSINKKF